MFPSNICRYAFLPTSSTKEPATGFNDIAWEKEKLFRRRTLNKVTHNLSASTYYEYSLIRKMLASTKTQISQGTPHTTKDLLSPFQDEN